MSVFSQANERKSYSDWWRKSPQAEKIPSTTTNPNYIFFLKVFDPTKIKEVPLNRRWKCKSILMTGWSAVVKLIRWKHELDIFCVYFVSLGDKINKCFVKNDKRSFIWNWICFDGKQTKESEYIVSFWVLVRLWTSLMLAFKRYIQDRAFSLGS